MEIRIQDFREVFRDYLRPGENNKFVNVRGANGSGKSSIPFSFINSDPYTFTLTYDVEGKSKVLATVCPGEGWLFLGSYKIRSGGADYVKRVDLIRESLKMVWDLPFNILIEGSIVSTTYSTYSALFKELNDFLPRKTTILSLLPPVDVSKERVYERNGGVPIKEELIYAKYAAVSNSHLRFVEDGFNCIAVDNSEVSKEDIKETFLKVLEGNVDKTKMKVVTPKREKATPPKAPRENLSSYPTTLIIPNEDEIRRYPWFKYYRKPNSEVEVNWENMYKFWYWVAERMNIWNERVNLKKEAPWTEDKILQELSFTNVIRDLDKGTIDYIDNILKRIDDPGIDLERRSKDIIISTMIYRLFIRRDVFEEIGWLFEIDRWEETWGPAREKLRKIWASGRKVFHGSYSVNSLWCVAPWPGCKDKLENAINLIENYWKPKVDEIYEVITTKDMKSSLEYLTKEIKCSGSFTAYEWLCDWALGGRHTTNRLVSWDDDNYVNIGPGNKRGLDFIFTKSGNLSDVEKNIYLRATWKEYLKRYGFYDRFISQLPGWMNGDINLRVVEHDLCEVSKYLNAYYGVGKRKRKFIQKSNAEDLVFRDENKRT